MILDKLSTYEQKIVHEVLKASVEGPFFPDWEFHTLMGIERTELLSLLASWPKYSHDKEEILFLAINNSFANLLRYPHGEDKALKALVSVDKQCLDDIFKKIRLLRNAGTH